MKWGIINGLIILVWAGHFYFGSPPGAALEEICDNGREDDADFADQDLVRIQSLQVFNRWGQMVYHGQDLPPNDSTGAWDDRTRQGPAPGGYTSMPCVC